MKDIFGLSTAFMLYLTAELIVLIAYLFHLDRKRYTPLINFCLDPGELDSIVPRRTGPEINEKVEEATNTF